MGNRPDASEIRRQMSDIRGHLQEEVDGIVDNARQLVSWRHYVKVFPWGSLAAAAALGYFAVPRRLEIVSPDAETLQKLAKDNRLVVEHRPRGEQRRSAASSLANLTANMLLRAGLAYVGQQAGKLLGEQTQDSADENVVTS